MRVPTIYVREFMFSASHSALTMFAYQVVAREEAPHRVLIHLGVFSGAY